MCISALIGGAAMLGGAALSSSAAKSAASTQAAAANRSADMQMEMYNRTRADLQPFMEGGRTGFNALMGNLDKLTAPIVMDQATLEQTPGYQFALKQGLRAAQNSATARGLGNSGAAMKGAMDYATGLASGTYQQQFNNAAQNQANAFNRLMGVTQIGQNSAAGVGAQGTQAANNAGNMLIGGANAQAASTMYGANAMNNALTGLGGMAMAGQFGNMGGLYGQHSGLAGSTGTSIL